VARLIKLKLFTTVAPFGVEQNGTRLPPLASQAAFDGATVGWFYDSTAHFLNVKFSHAGGNVTIGFGPDSVGDGVTDSWRAYYGITDDNADSDGDGLTNKQEYFAGTNPNDPTSSFAIQSVVPQTGGPGFVVSWASEPNIVYQVQWKNLLSDSMWQGITPTFTGTGSVLSWTDDGSQTGGVPADERFYRVSIP
jgi:hypothetical protein